MVRCVSSAAAGAMPTGPTASSTARAGASSRPTNGRGTFIKDVFMVFSALLGCKLNCGVWRLLNCGKVILTFIGTTHSCALGDLHLPGAARHDALLLAEAEHPNRLVIAGPLRRRVFGKIGHRAECEGQRPPGGRIDQRLGLTWVQLERGDRGILKGDCLGRTARGNLIFCLPAAGANFAEALADGQDPNIG